MSRGPIFVHGARDTLAIREMSSKPMETFILNECFSDFLAYNKSQAGKRFERFAKKVRGLSPLFEY